MMQHNPIIDPMSIKSNVLKNIPSDSSTSDPAKITGDIDGDVVGLDEVETVGAVGD